MENNIFVMYVPPKILEGKGREDVQLFIANLKKEDSFKKSSVIVLPGEVYKLECINPKYVTSQELINKMEDMIKDIDTQFNNKL